MARGRRTPNELKVDAALRGDLRRFDAPRPMPLVPGINGFPLMPSVSPDGHKGPRVGSRGSRAKAARTGNLAEGMLYEHTAEERGEVIDKVTGMPLGYVEPAEDIRQRDWASRMASENRAEERQRMLRRQREAVERARAQAIAAARR